MHYGSFEYTVLFYKDYKIKNSTKNNIYNELVGKYGQISFAANNTTDKKLILRFPNSQFFTLKLYKDGIEVWNFEKELNDSEKEPITIIIYIGERLILNISNLKYYPEHLAPGEYEYEFYLNAEGWEDVEHLKGVINIVKRTNKQ